LCLQQKKFLKKVVQFSFWFYFDASLGSARSVLSNFAYTGTNGRGWIVEIASGASAIRLATFNDTTAVTITSGTLTNGTWNHVVGQINSGSAVSFYVNGTLAGTNASAVDSRSMGFYVGCHEGANFYNDTPAAAATGISVADLHLWRDGSLLSQAQIQSLYNAGAPVPTGFFPVVRNEYELTGQSGQKLSMRARISRSTTAVNPQILNLGILKTS
jgi:hypothetical protein